MAGRAKPKPTKRQDPPLITDPKTLGERIAASRQKLGLSQAEFIRQMGVAHTTVRAWEGNENYPSIELLRKASEVLHVSTSYLLDGGAEVTEPQYESWLEFLATEAGRTMTEGERRTLASIRFDERLGAPTAQLYYGLLIGLRMRPPS
jgi:transcriptional regulator with XRE-family HTH domain